ncbi:MAG: hypothetical protein H6754_04115 [Candidatus Omnitrophica bacterium]|nr:hypothetical protein [Candidatus Omnitrophota bacterium]
MKKLNVCLLAVAMIAVFAAPSFAMLRKDLASAKGTVSYVNASRTEITIKDGAGKESTFTSDGISVDVTPGSPVVVLYTIGTNKAKTVRVIHPKKAGAKMEAPAATTYTAPKATTSDSYGMPKAKKSSW